MQEAGGGELAEITRNAGLAELCRFHNLLGAHLAIVADHLQDLQTGIVGEGGEAADNVGAVEFGHTDGRVLGLAGAEQNDQVFLVRQAAHVRTNVRVRDEEDAVRTFKCGAPFLLVQVLAGDEARRFEAIHFGEIGGLEGFHQFL